MAGLFDFIKAAMVLAGGSRMARQEEEDIQSQIEHRRDTINVQRENTAAQKEMAAAQRDLTERLQGKEQEHQKGMQATTIDWEKEKQKKEQEFQGSQNKFTRDHAKELAQLEIEAREKLQGKAIVSQELIAKNEQEMRWKIAQLEARLREKGLALDREKMVKDLSVEKMQVLIKAIDLSTRATTGMEGLMTAATGSGEMGALLNAKQNQILTQTLKVIDPDGKMGLRDLKISDYVQPSLDYSKGAGDAQNVLKSFGFAPQSKASSPTAPPPPLIPQDVDNLAPSPAPAPAPALARSALNFNIDGLNPADVLALDRVAFEIQQRPEAIRPEAFREYQSIIEDPTFLPVGDNTGSADYRKRMTGYLQKATGFDFGPSR